MKVYSWTTTRRPLHTASTCIGPTIIGLPTFCYANEVHCIIRVRLWINAINHFKAGHLRSFAILKLRQIESRWNCRAYYVYFDLPELTLYEALSRSSMFRLRLVGLWVKPGKIMHAHMPHGHFLVRCRYNAVIVSWAVECVRLRRRSCL